MKIPIAKPEFNIEEEKAVIEVIRSGWVAQGSKVLELEQLFAKFIGAKEAVVVSSATTGLFLSLYISGVGPGDEVIVPSLSFIATANVVMHLGAKPVFVDIDPRIFNIDPDLIEKAITKKTKAIIPVDQIGLPCQIDKILSIAKKHKLKVIEDAACAIGASYKGKKVGVYSPLTVFSFHPRKVITTGEGGVIVTNNLALAKRLRLLRHQGMSVSDVARHKSTKVIIEKYPEVGFNFRLSDIQAAVGVEQLKKLPSFLDKRLKIAQKYNFSFKDHKFIEVPYVPDNSTHSWQSYMIMLKNRAPLSRDTLMQLLLDKGISTRRAVMMIHKESPYRKLYPKLKLVKTEEVSSKGVILPLYTQMTDDEQSYVIDNILSALS